MEELLARARQADAEVAKVRQGAQPAGDPQPYRVVEEDGQDDDGDRDD